MVLRKRVVIRERLLTKRVVIRERVIFQKKRGCSVQSKRVLCSSSQWAWLSERG